MGRSPWRYLPPVLIHLVAGFLTDLPWLNYRLPGLRSLHWTAIHVHPFYYVEYLIWIGITAVALWRGRRKAWFDGLLLLLGAISLATAIAGNPVSLTPFMGLLVAIALLIQAMRKRTDWAATLSVTVLALISFVLLDLPLADTVTLPGTIVQMDKVIQMEGGQPTGRIMGLTTETQPATLLHKLIRPNMPFMTFATREANAIKDATISPVFLEQAHEAGLAVGLKYLGRGGVAERAPGFLVYGVVPQSPADGKVQPGDQVTAINGTTIADWATGTAALRSHQVGETISLTLTREGREVKVDLKLIANPADPSLVYVGIRGQDAWHYESPVPHKTVDLVTGNSYGSVFALTVMDQLTPGGITNGNRVIGTGTIDGSGNIGEVGGVPLKAYLATLSDADVLFVPASQLAEAERGAQGKLQIVPVTQFQEILDWLKAHPKER